MIERAVQSVEGMVRVLRSALPCGRLARARAMEANKNAARDCLRRATTLLREGDAAGACKFARKSAALYPTPEAEGACALGICDRAPAGGCPRPAYSPHRCRHCASRRKCLPEAGGWPQCSQQPRGPEAAPPPAPAALGCVHPHPPPKQSIASCEVGLPVC